MTLRIRSRDKTDKKKRVTHIGSYEVGKTLGNGSFGKVKLGTNVYTKEKVAIKFFKNKKLCSPQQLESSKREIEIMKLLKHPHIVRLIDVIECADQGTTYLIVEYVSGGELFDYIVANGMIKEKEARRFVRQIISAVEYCHSSLIVHRDLKPENMLIDSNGNIKISDFGLSNMIEPGKLLDSFCGSPLYAAPEILLAERYVGPPIDVWSMGVIVYAILCGHLPWSGDSQAEISFHSTRGIYDEPAHLTPSARNFIRQMLNPIAKDRLTIEQMRQHPWVNEGFADPPPSLLTVRACVVEVRESILVQLESLGFTNREEMMRRILQNECCQVVAIYHLLLDRAVEEEMAQVARSLKENSPPRGSTTPRKISLSNRENSFRLAPILEDDQGKMHKDESMVEASKQTQYRSGSLSSSSGSQAAEVTLSTSLPSQPLSSSVPGLNDAYFTTRASLTSSTPNPFTDGTPTTQPPAPTQYVSHRRNSVGAGTPSYRHSVPQHGQVINYFQMQHPAVNPALNSNMVSIPIPNAIPNLPSISSINYGQHSPVRPSVIQQPVQHPRGRRMSLDSRAIAAQMQMAAENPPAQQQQQQQPHDPQQLNGSSPPSSAPSLANPRLIKGIFKSDTTSTKSPEETAKNVKKILSEIESFFVKRKTPFLFECIDETSNVKFQLEICKLQQINLTGIHLKRVSGDIWLYKNLCTDLVERIKL